jgi:hypothetical protein
MELLLCLFFHFPAGTFFSCGMLFFPPSPQSWYISTPLFRPQKIMLQYGEHEVYFAIEQTERFPEY